MKKGENQISFLNYTKIFADAKKFLKFMKGMFSNANIKFCRDHVAYDGEDLFLSPVRVGNDTPVFEKVPVHPNLLDGDLHNG